jgi:hypothetical protein
MLNFRRSGQCDAPDGVGLYGNLGLREWVRSAFAPVEDEILKVGYQPAPGGKSSTPLPPIILEFAETPDKEFNLLMDNKEALLRRSSMATTYVQSARRHIKGYYDLQDAIQRIYLRQPVDNKKIEQYEKKAIMHKQVAFDNAGRLLGTYEKADEEYTKVKAVYPILLARYPEAGSESEKEQHRRIKAAKEEADGAYATIKTAKDEAVKSVKELPHDPPINSLSHSVNFAVELKGGMAPNWTLVSVRGPSASGNLLSGVYTRTHTLTIVMGHPTEVPDELSRQLSTLAIIQSLRAFGQ